MRVLQFRAAIQQAGVDLARIRAQSHWRPGCLGVLVAEPSALVAGDANQGSSFALPLTI